LLQPVAVGICPQCQGVLREMRWQNVELRACEGCGGVWLKQDRLGALLLQPAELQDRLLRAIAAVRTGRIKKFNPAPVCPHCELLMFSAPLGNMTERPIHGCPKCRDLFLPDGVLAEIIAARRQ
jgi:Zn-finger nucleic acid-binding protein